MTRGMSDRMTTPTEQMQSQVIHSEPATQKLDDFVTNTPLS